MQALPLETFPGDNVQGEAWVCASVCMYSSAHIHPGTWPCLAGLGVAVYITDLGTCS